MRWFNKHDFIARSSCSICDIQSCKSCEFYGLKSCLLYCSTSLRWGLELRVLDIMLNLFDLILNALWLLSPWKRYIFYKNTISVVLFGLAFANLSLSFSKSFWNKFYYCYKFIANLLCLIYLAYSLFSMKVWFNFSGEGFLLSREEKNKKPDCFNEGPASKEVSVEDLL